jgi:Carboxypeptidase regulatory-like domain
MKKAPVLIAVILALLILSGPYVSGQEFGAIKGVVKEASGNPIQGVVVTLTGSKIVKMSTVTKEGGNFRFVSLPVASDYVLKVELPGFKTVVREKLAVAFDRDLNFQITLEQSPISEEVVVQGQAPVIDIKRAQVGVSVGSDMIMGLPTARNPWVIMALVPGMLIDREDVGGNEGGQQSSYYGHGSKEDDNTWNIDGANITDNSALGAAPSYVNMASYEEIQINYGNNDIRSQTGGVQVNMVSRRGGNRVSGMFYLDAEDKNWQADNVPPDLRAVGYTAAGVNKVYLYGANVGGPIIRDKLWLFGTWGIQDIDKLTLSGSSDKTWLQSGYARLDFQLTPTTRINGFLEYDSKLKWGRAMFGYTEQDADTLWDQTGPSYLWKGQLEQTFGNWYLDAKVMYTDGGFYLIPAKGHRTADGSGSYFTLSHYPSRYLSGNTEDYGTNRNSTDYSANATYFAEKFLGGDHEFKFGVDYMTATTTSYSLYEGNIQLNYFGPDETMPTGQRWEAWLLRDYLVNDYFQRFSAYVQDTMTYGRLAINVGLRYDRESSMVKNLNIPASPWLPQYMPAVKLDEFNPGVKWEVFSPRFSLSYDVTGKGKDVLKLAVARYGSQSGNNLADFINPVGWTEIDLYWQDLNGDGRVTSNELFGYDWDTGTMKDPNDPAYWLYSSRTVNPDDPTSIAAKNRFDPGFNSPLLDELTLSYEKELSTDLAARLEFFYKKRHRDIWTQAMSSTGEIEGADNYYLAGRDATTGYDYYGRTTRFSYRYRTNHQKAYDQYLGGQMVFTKRLSGRWMLNASVTYSDWRRYYKGEYLGVIDDLSYRDEYNLGPNNEAYFDGGVVAAESGGSGSEGVYVNSRWSAKLSALYELPLGVSVSGVMIARDGYPIRPYNIVNLPGIGDENIYGNPGGKFGDKRLPAFWTLSFRVEKRIMISDRSSVSIAMDAFNVSNSALPLKEEASLTAANYSQDLLILNPRIFRFGIRFEF